MGAQAKAIYGLTLNYKQFEILVQRLLDERTLEREQLQAFMEETGVIRFPDPFTDGFRWDDNGHLVYPGMSPEVSAATYKDRYQIRSLLRMYH